MAADVRRWGRYCRRTSSSAALTLGASGKDGVQVPLTVQHGLCLWSIYNF